MKLESLSGKRSDGFGPPGQMPLELTQEGEATLVSGVVNERPTGATHVELRFKGRTLTIKAMYQPKRRKEAYTGVISLPLDLKEPSYLFPLLEGERPWGDWLQIEGFAREAVDVMPIPVHLVRVFDQHLMALRAARNGPAVSPLLSARPTERLRKSALAGQSYAKVAEHVRSLPENLRFLADTPDAKHEAIFAFGSFLRLYEEFFREKQRRDSRNAYEKLTAVIRLAEEE